MTTDTISSGLIGDLREHLDDAATEYTAMKRLGSDAMKKLQLLVNATGYYGQLTTYCTNKNANGQVTFHTGKSGRPEFVTAVFHRGGSVEITRVISLGRVDGSEVKPCPVWDYSKEIRGTDVAKGIMARMGDLDPEGFGKYLDDEDFTKEEPELLLLASAAEPAPSEQ